MKRTNIYATSSSSRQRNNADLAIANPATGLSTVTIPIRSEDYPILRRVDFDGVFDIREYILQIFQNAINEAYGHLQITPQDRVGVLISGNDISQVDVQVGVPFRNSTDLTPDSIMDAIENVLNSSETILLDFTATFTRRRQQASLNLGAGTNKILGWTGDMGMYTKAKRGIIRIHPTDDPYRNFLECLYQFIALGLASLICKDLIPPIPALGLDNTSLDIFVTHSSKYMYRHYAAQKIAAMCSDISKNQLAILARVEEMYNIHIALLGFHRQFNIVYPDLNILPKSEYKPTIFGLVSEITKDGAWRHVDYVTKPWVLQTKSTSRRVNTCYFCFSSYIHKARCISEDCKHGKSLQCNHCHTCAGVCFTCRTRECGSVIPFDEDACQPFLRPKKCRNCHRNFFSPRCVEIHDATCTTPQLVLMCEGCNRAPHGSIPCGQVKCIMCNKCYIKGAKHNCFLTRMKCKKEFNRYWVYDVETALDENKRHTLYLITAWPMYSQKGIEDLSAKYPHRILNNDHDRPVFVFWGLGDPACGTGAYEFFKFLCEPAVRNTEFFAHNAGKYDNVFVEYYMTKYKQLICKKIQRGLKLVLLNFPQLDIKFKDSLCFIPTALRSMSKDFGIEETKKGHFPHKLITVEYLRNAETLGFKVSKPHRDYFYTDFSAFCNAEEEQKDLDTFLDAFYSQSGSWDLREDAILYCISDTVLLGKTLIEFREKALQMTCEIDRPTDVVEIVDLDPLRSVTLPSAVMNFYMSQMLPTNTIAVIDRYLSTNEIGKELWLLYMENQHNCIITRCEFIDGIPISGYDDQNRIYRFIHCYDNGCNFCYLNGSWNSRRGLAFGECFVQVTLERRKLREIRPTSTIVEKWSHSWEREMQFMQPVMKWLKDDALKILQYTPLDPRDAYKGGISELFKLRVKNDISMVDFVSQYPTSLIGDSFDPYDGSKVKWPLPVGIPTRLFLPTAYVIREEVLGVIKCTILPPKQLYVPFLGYRVMSRLAASSYEVLYGLCRECMIHRNCDYCEHGDNDRQFTGTWTLSEIVYAQTLGYKVVHITEVWEYEEQQSDLFKDFIVPFMITKICCKKAGLVENDSFTTQGQKIVDYVYDITGKMLQPSDFRDSPSERTISKLIMNSFYGKWGQRAIWPEVQSFDEEEIDKCNRILTDPNIDVKFARVTEVDERQVIVLEYERKNVLAKGDGQKNDHIAAYVTAYGRIMLNRLLQKLGDTAVYCDTDSAFHTFTNNAPYQTGFRIGDLELELPKASNWVGNGRKSYTYSKTNGKHVCKQKGISLRQSMVDMFTPESMLRMINKTKLMYDEYKETDAFIRKKKAVPASELIPSITVKQTTFRTVAETSLVSYKETLEQTKRTTFLLWALKRIPLWPEHIQEAEMIDTIPFGYCKDG